MPSSGRRTTVGDGARTQMFVEDVFGSLQRVEQRRWARAYLWALTHISGKKTPRRLARAGSLPSAAVNGLHQFINGSPWDWQPVRRRLALWVSANAAPYAWTVAELIIPKNGEHSVGVHHRVDAATGRTVSCQRAIVLFLATDTDCFPVDWSLVLSGPWDWDVERRRRARVPEAEPARPAGAHVLGYAADVLAQPLLPRVPWVLDLTRCEDASGVLAGLARQGVDMVCEVDPDQVVLIGRHTPTVSTVGALMEMRHARKPHLMTRQAPGGRARTVPVYSCTGTVRLPLLGNGGEGNSREYRVLKRPDPDGRRSPRYWITSLTDRDVEEVLALVRGLVATVAAVTTMRERFGVLDFEGRSFPGWHHHMTMASAAYVYQRLHAAPPAPTVSPPPELIGTAS
ncbi:transposase [Streptomyces sp. NPDC051051]|uniref:IS701 family transposase n=1 Tax=Streptomyces sp. NPDC051051 TaxID=3155666 RepID=UPI0034130E1A